MGAAWIESDAMLQRSLSAIWSDYLSDNNYKINLYQNDHVPSPNDDASDYTAADFAGYEEFDILGARWGAVALNNHVAIITYNEAIQWISDPTAQPQTIYGYFVLDDSGVFQWSEYFADAVTMNPNDQLSITPILRHTSYPFD